MLAEFSIEPIGEGAHLGETIAGIVEAVRESGIEHQVTAMGTLLEGEPAKIWDYLGSPPAVSLQSEGEMRAGDDARPHR